jgi:hypothetical protein
MGTLSPEAFVKLYREMVDSAREAGWPGMNYSPGFIRLMELEWDARFKKPASPEDCA